MPFFKLGAQLEGPLGDRGKWLVPNRVYHLPIRWDETELAEGEIVLPGWAFGTIQGLNDQLGRSNYQLVIGIKTTPQFYSLPPHARNSPPVPAHYTSFAKFCEIVIMALEPDALELYNEPEFTVVESAKWAKFFGGWGNMGAEYGKLVRTCYSYLRKKGIKTSIVAGASFGLVDVDRSLAFLKAAVGAGMKADYWSFHAYFKYSDVLYGGRDFYQALWFSKVAFEVFPVPQVISETSVRRDGDLPEDQSHREWQALLLEFYLKYMPSHPVESVWWYTLADNNWEHTDLVSKQVIYPAYEVWSKAE